MKRAANLQRETLLKILDNSYDEIFATDADGLVIYVNPICERHYGLKADDVIGRKAESLVKEGYYSPPIIHRVLREKRQINIIQETNIGKTLLVTATPVFNETGELDMVVQNARDVTQLEVIKHELDKANRLIQEYRDELRPQLDLDVGAFGLIGQSQCFRDLIRLAGKIAPTDTNVILLGESGTGKGVLSRYIHQTSKRSNGPYICINCAAIPDELIESELFGYVGGAYTGAHQKGRIGRLELATAGTLLLDEIAELPLHLQAKLLDVVQNREFMPVGARKVKSLDARIICATNRNLHAMVDNGSFRSDLYHRLKVIEIEIPPLRKRPEDILPLAYYYLSQFDRQFDKIHTLSPEIVEAMLSYSWPGNIREFMHVLELIAVTVDNGEITVADLPDAIARNTGIQAKSKSNSKGLKSQIDAFTAEVITTAYQRLKSSYKVARELNISQSTAHRLIRRYIDSLPSPS